MSPAKAAVTPCEIYNHALKYSRHDHVPPGVPLPNSTNTWLPENIAILERYVTWLAGGGTSAYVIRVIHIPMAGHILSLNHKPSTALDLDNDLQAGMDYILAKGLGFCWTKNCRLSMLKFRRFLLHERGLSIDTRKCSTHIHPHCTSNLRQHRATFATSLVVKRVFC